MFGLCIESSHEKGMGHLYRALNLISFFNKKKENYIVLINNDTNALKILKNNNVPYEIVDLGDCASNWETNFIRKYSITLWINDRLDTNISHNINVVQNNIPIVTFDDRGSGSVLADINFAGMTFSNSDTKDLKGKRIYYGVEYMILNEDINQYQRFRTDLNKIMITLGGSDTYGVTIKVVNILKELGKKADIFIGPSFKHIMELEKITNGEYEIINSVPSLIEAFFNYDLAITGGGITAFEANGSGLPCIVIANEIHEIKNAEFLQAMGSSIFAGYYKDINHKCFKKKLDLSEMSKKGITGISSNGVVQIYNKLKELGQ